MPDEDRALIDRAVEHARGVEEGRAGVAAVVARATSTVAPGTAACTEDLPDVWLRIGSRDVDHPRMAAVVTTEGEIVLERQAVEWAEEAADALDSDMHNALRGYEHLSTAAVQNRSSTLLGLGAGREIFIVADEVQIPRIEGEEVFEAGVLRGTAVLWDHGESEVVCVAAFSARSSAELTVNTLAAGVIAGSLPSEAVARDFSERIDEAIRERETWRVPAAAQ